MMELRITLEDLRARCVECGDCWEWQGIAAKCGTPKINVHVGYGKSGRTVLSTRRVVWELAKGPLTSQKLVTFTCGNAKCINPAHLKLTDHAKVASINGSRVDVKLKRSISSSRSTTKAKITREQAMQIRYSDRSSREVASEYGIGVSAVNKIRSGENWKDYSNPFAGLGA